MKIDYLPQLPYVKTEAELNQINPLVLSFVGDAVQTLFVRTRLALESDKKTFALHKEAAGIINATSQAEAVKNIMPLLTENELAVYKRSRNSKSNTSAKHASIIDYRIASGFEGLIGYLYLAGRHERLSELLEAAYKNEE